MYDERAETKKALPLIGQSDYMSEGDAFRRRPNDIFLDTGKHKRANTRGLINDDYTINRPGSHNYNFLSWQCRIIIACL